MAIWMRDNHILTDADGHPLDCPWCPCDPTTCADVIDRQIERCEATGAYYLHQTGYLYSTVDLLRDIDVVIFTWIDSTYNESTLLYESTLKALNCDCEEIALASASFAAPPADPSLFGFEFFHHEKACQEFDCNITIMAFIRTALTNGWTLHGNGFIASKYQANLNYNFSTITGCLACADTGDTYHLIFCDCTVDSLSKANRIYIDHDICTCYDVREILLAYPELFGVHDVSFGNHTIAKIAYNTPEYTWAEKFVKVSGSSDFAAEIDYRTMYVSFEDITDSYRYTVYGFVAPGGYTMSFYDPLESNLEITFDGHGEPFGTVHGLKMRFNKVFWKGTTRGDYNGMSKTEIFWTQSEAENWISEMSSTSGATFLNNMFEGFSHEPPTCPPAQLSFSPSFTFHAGYIEYDSREEYYIAHAPWNEPNDAAYCVRWMHTNKGVLIDGAGYQDTYPILGFESCLSSWTNPPQSGWEYVELHCAETEAEEPQNVENPGCCPYHGGTLIANIMEDMGGCHDAEWWNAIMEEEEEAAD